MTEDKKDNTVINPNENSAYLPSHENAEQARGSSDNGKGVGHPLHQRSITSFFTSGAEKDGGNFLRTMLRTMLRGGLGHLLILSFLLMLFVAFVVAVREVLLPFILAVVIAYILSPVVNRLHEIKLGRFNMPRWTAVILIYITGALIIYLFSIVALPRFSGELKNLVHETPQFFRTASQEYLPKANEKLNAWLENLRSPFEDKETVHDPLRGLEDVDSTVTSESEETQAGPVLANPREASDEESPSGGGRALHRREKSGQEHANLAKDAAKYGAGAGQDEKQLVLVREGMELDIQMIGEGHFRLKPVKSPDGMVASAQPTFELDKNINEYLNALLTRSEAYILQAFSLGQSLVKRVIASIMTLVLTLMIAAFLLSDVPRVTGFFRSLVPLQYRTEYDEILKGVNTGLGGVIRGQLMICLVNGTLTGLGLILLGVKYASILALLAAVLSLIPIFGTIISSIPAVGIALTQSFGLGVAVLVWIIVIHLIEANILNPKIIGTSAKIHPVWVVFALVAGEHTYGLFGALLAVPIFSIFQTLFLYFRKQAYSSGGAES